MNSDSIFIVCIIFIMGIITLGVLYFGSISDKDQYECKQQAIQKNYTPEQINKICYN